MSNKIRLTSNFKIITKITKQLKSNTKTKNQINMFSSSISKAIIKLMLNYILPAMYQVRSIIYRLKNNRKKYNKQQTKIIQHHGGKINKKSQKESNKYRMKNILLLGEELNNSQKDKFKQKYNNRTMLLLFKISKENQNNQFTKTNNKKFNNL